MVVVYAGFAGAQTSTANLDADRRLRRCSGSASRSRRSLFGDVFRAFNPWRAVGARRGWLGAGACGREAPEPLAYPQWLGRWPAALGILAFAWVELVYVNKDDPSTLAIMVLAYAAVQLVGMSVYGIEPWTRNGDAFGVYFGLFSRLSPLHWRDARAATCARRWAARRSSTPVPGPSRCCAR